MSEVSDWIRLENENGVTRLVLDRAERRNALTRSMIELLTGHVKQLSAATGDSAIRLLKLAAAGPVFCAGMDLAEMQDRAADDHGPEAWRKDALVYRDLLQALWDAPFPVLAVVQGPVLAGGVGLVLACDLVIAASTTFFALPEPQRGITAAMVTPLLTYRVGAGHASHALLAGGRLEAASTVAWGLCHEVVEPASLPATEDRWTQSILTGSPLALAATKENLRAFAGAQLPAQLTEAAHKSALARETEDAREGLQAFLEKRKPAWQPPGQDAL